VGERVKIQGVGDTLKKQQSAKHGPLGRVVRFSFLFHFPAPQLWFHVHFSVVLFAHRRVTFWLTLVDFLPLVHAPFSLTHYLPTGRRTRAVGRRRVQFTPFSPGISPFSVWLSRSREFVHYFEPGALWFKVTKMCFSYFCAINKWEKNR